MHWRGCWEGGFGCLGNVKKKYLHRKLFFTGGASWEGGVRVSEMCVLRGVLSLDAKVLYQGPYLLRKVP